MNSKKISIVMFKASAHECLNEFMEFSRFFKFYNSADSERARFLDGKITFSMVEHENTEEWVKEKYVKSVYAAMKRLFKLNTSFKAATGEVFLAKLNGFEDYVEVLETIAAAI